MRRFSRWSGLVVLGLGVAACQDDSGPTSPSGPSIDARVGQGAQFTPQQAARWFEGASTEALAVPGAVYADLREESNRLEIGVEHPIAGAAVLAATRRLGIPDDAVTVVQSAPIVLMATLRDRVRPLQGGLQIHFTQYLCTFGFNATHSGEASFITNSHCTAKQGGVQNTVYYQPLSSTDPTVIGTEVEDPTYRKNFAGCPRGRSCRYSDAARVRHATSDFTLGRIARPTALGSLTIVGFWTINAEGSPAASETVSKVGRTTGWTQGPVTSTCATVNVSGTNITQICQAIVTSSSTMIGGGDSGSPVFRTNGTSNVTLLGIAWGGSGDGKTLVFSPIANIERADEIGPLTTF